MRFSAAWLEMLSGRNVRRPHWSGYWSYSNEAKCVVMHSANGIPRPLQRIDEPIWLFSNIASDDWEVV